jgi:2-keto-4-pentenoate hydratase/2-oxohepta-3-ene-1,7-dioic acid hydratase in catechol pathway
LRGEVIRRYVFFTHPRGTSAYGLLEGDRVRQLQGDIFSNPRETDRAFRLEDVSLGLPLARHQLHKVIGVALAFNNPQQPPRYLPHPTWFSKLPSALNTHESDVYLSEHAKNFNFEGEMVLVIGKGGRHISIEDAPAHIFGVTIGNDFSENTWFYEDAGTEQPSQVIAKSSDSWACLYTTIVTGLNYTDLALEVRINETTVASGRTSSMVNSPAYLVSYLSHFITLQPGDVIYTGTVNPPVFPGMRHSMRDGDLVEVEIEGIGTLRNRVVALEQTGNSYRMPGVPAL